MICDTCKQESPVVLRVVVDKHYNRALARPRFNCQSCFEKKEVLKQRSGLGAVCPQPTAKEKE